jgi:hypothetical protein
MDYIPKKDSEVLSWSANFLEGVGPNAAAWGIPEGEVTAIGVAYRAFADIYIKAKSPSKTAVIVAEKNAAREALVAKIRAMVSFRLQNPVITDAQRIDLGLHVRDTTRTNIPVPTTRPELNIDVLDFRRLKVLFYDQGSDNKAKPYGVNGAVIILAILDAPPADHSALTRSVLATRTPHILEFTEEERGKTVYVAICWQNEKGQMGPWSEIVSALVP